MMIAITDNDEVNMVAQGAHSMFQTPKKICSIRSSDYLISEELFGKHGVAVDDVISPEHIVSNYMEKLIDLPGHFRF